MRNSDVPIDPFETATGLPDDYEGTIVSSEFGFRANYGPDVPVLIWAIEGPEVIPQEVLISIGKDWDVRDGGARVVRPREGLSALFQGSSHYGQILQRAKEDGWVENLRGRGSGPADAGIWIGLRFHWKREKKEYGGNIGTREHLMPVAFLGVVGEAKPLPESEGRPPLTAKEKVATAKLRKLAADSEDWATFQMAATDLDLPESIMSQVADDAECELLYESLREG